MKAKEDLFQLIKSLGQMEKRYFKVFASMNEKKGTNIYVQLFDEIDSQATYDEQAIREKFKKENFIKQLTASKYYLQKLILKSLGNFHGNNSADIRLSNLLISIEILYQKGLLDACLQLITRSKEMARKIDAYTYFLQFISWEKKAMNKKQFLNVDDQAIKHLKEEEKNAMTKLQNLNDYDNLNMEWWHLLKKKGMSRNRAEKKQYESIIGHSLVKDAKHALTGKAMINYHFLNTVISHEAGNMQQYLYYARSLVDFFQANPEQAEHTPSVFAAAINNLGAAYLFLNQYDKAIQLCDEFETILSLKNNIGSERIRSAVYASTLEIKTSCFIKLGEFQNTIKLVPEFEHNKTKLRKDIKKGTYLFITYNFSVCYLGKGEYKRSLKWLNEVLNDPDPEISEDLHCFARILNLIIHYELQDEDLLEYIVRSTYRFLYKRNRLYKIESSVLNFLRRSPSFDTPEKLTSAFKKLRSELILLQKDKYESRAFEFFDFISWLESKIEKRPFAEIVREKTKG